MGGRVNKENIKEERKQVVILFQQVFNFISLWRRKKTRNLKKKLLW
jgi:hypothetical protein